MKVSLFITLLLLSPFALSASVFQPDGCEYGVEFPQKPIYQTVTTEYGEHLVALISNDEFFLKAECMPLIDRGSDVDKMRAIMLYAKQNGIQYPTFQQASESLGRIVSVRGTKLVANKHITIRSIWYYGQTSALSIQVGALSPIYPTLEILKFISSVSK